MSYQWYLVCLATMGRLAGVRKYNMDATTYVFEPPHKGSQIALIKEDGKYAELVQELASSGQDCDVLFKRNQQAKSTNSGCKLGFGIKTFLCASAGGTVGDMVLIVAVKDMEADQWHHESIPGLSITSDTLSGPGHMYFCKTRCGTRDTYMYVEAYYVYYYHPVYFE